MDSHVDHVTPDAAGCTAAEHSGINRRKFVMFGGAAIATSAVIAACKGATPPVSVAPPTSATTVLVGSPRDLALLNTAISLEALAQAVYTEVVAGTLVTTSTTQDLLKLFQTQHGEHQDELTRTVSAAGGKPFTQANPVIMAQVVQPRLAALKTEADVVSLAYDLEHMLAATCQAGVGTFDHATLNTLLIQIGAIEARHCALWSIISGKSTSGTPDGAFEADQDAVSAGTGI
jgi:hypothetical protein